MQQHPRALVRGCCCVYDGTMNKERKSLKGVPPLERMRIKSHKVEGGHVAWNGRRSASGAPCFKIGYRQVPVSHIAFEARAGRPPVGIVKAECDYAHCLNGRHLTDEIERRELRLIERSFYGMDDPWDVCSRGLHSWQKYGRIEPAPALSLYCKGCSTDRSARFRDARREEASA